MNEERERKVAFADEALLKAFNGLKQAKFEERQLAERLERAINELKQDPFAGTPIPRRLWPKEYVRNYSIDNLRKYDLPNAWRLIYTLRGNTIEIVSVILEWFSHKEYEKKFKYKVK